MGNDTIVELRRPDELEDELRLPPVHTKIWFHVGAWLEGERFEQLLKKAPASGFQILAAYVYYRTGKFMDARQIINAAYQESPKSRAALALKIAIDSKLNNAR